MKILSELLVILSVSFIFVSCDNKSREDNTIPVTDESVSEKSHYENGNMGNLSSPDYDSAPHIPNRQKAISDAFELGKELGRIDGRKGINDCHTYATAYSDDWIKQAFIQGYEWGLAEVGYDDSESYSGADNYTEYDEPSFYYDDDDY